MMHDQENIKLCDDEYHYKNIKLKLYESNYAICFNPSYTKPSSSTLFTKLESFF